MQHTALQAAVSHQDIQEINQEEQPQGSSQDSGQMCNPCYGAGFKSIGHGTEDRDADQQGRQSGHGVVDGELL